MTGPERAQLRTLLSEMNIDAVILGSADHYDRALNAIDDYTAQGDACALRRDLFKAGVPGRSIQWQVANRGETLTLISPN